MTAVEQFTRSDNPTITDPNSLRAGRPVTNQNVATLEFPYRRDPWSLTPRSSWRIGSIETGEAGPGERSQVLTLGLDGTVTVLPVDTTLRAGVETTRAQFRTAEDFAGETYRVGATRSVGQRLELSADGSYTVRRPSRRDAFSIAEGTVGSRFNAWEVLSLSSRVGYQQSDVSDRPGAQGVTYRSDVSYEGARVTAVLGSELSIQETFTQAQNAGLVRLHTSTLTLTYGSTDLVRLSATGRVSRNEFLESGADRTDTVLSWTFSASSRLGRTMTLTGSWEHTQRHSTRSREDFAVNALRLELLVDFR